VPFLRSRPGRLLAATTLLVVAAGALLPASPLAATLGFEHLPAGFFAVLALMVAAYVVLAEAGKQEFFAHFSGPVARSSPVRHGRVHRRAARFTHRGPLARGRDRPPGR
jgi:Mg2+-importing ATPase